VDRGEAYKLLAARLNEARVEGYAALLARVGQPARSETEHHNGEAIVIDVAVSWDDRERGTVLVCATANGPSTWMTQRLEESIILGPDAPAAG